MNGVPRSVRVEVLCYLVDARDYYSELKEFNFLADLDLDAPLDQSLADNAHPGLGFGDPDYNFRCYSANFLGEHISLQQRPLEVRYIEDSLREDKNVVIYLCKEALQSQTPVTNGRERTTVTPADCRPSDLAENFLHFTCGSISGYESGYISDTGRQLIGSKISNTSTSSGVGTEADAEDIDEVFPLSPPRDVKKSRPPRQLTIHPSLSPSLSPTPRPHCTTRTPPESRLLRPTATIGSLPVTIPHKEEQLQHPSNHHRPLRPTASAFVLGSPPAPLPIPGNRQEQFELSSSVPGHSYLKPQREKPRSKSPTLWSPKQKKQEERRKKNVTLDPRILALKQRDLSSSLSYHQAFLGLEPGHTISSPIHQPLNPAEVQLRDTPQLRRGRALRRRSVQDLVKTNRLSYDLSTSPVCVRLHFSNQQLQSEAGQTLSLEQTLELHIRIFNYMTVGELKASVCDQIQRQSSIVVSPPSALVLYYTSSDGYTDYELLNDSQFMLHTGFHKQLAETSPPDPAEARLEARLEARIGSRLPEKELRVLYRISQLTGVLLEEDVVAVGVDTSSLTVLPNCDCTELQYARRSLHSYMMKVVKERNEMEYCSCRDISSREASMQLSLMTPADNTILINFHYKTEFSLKRKLSIHTHADTALRELFPGLVASGLVRDSVEDYTLQVSGEESYIYGQTELISFRHIRKCIVKSEPIHLSVTEKKPFETERPHHFSIMPLDPLSTTAMNHYELSSLSPIRLEGVWSSWEIDRKLRITKLHVENLPRVSGRGSRLRVELRLLHGCRDLCNPLLASGDVGRSSQGLSSWSEDLLEFDIEIRDIPKAARILVTIAEGSKSKGSSHGDKPQLHYWGMISVFDFSGRLRVGSGELRLWKGEGNTRTGDTVVPPNLATHPANNPQPMAVRVTLSFETIHPGPIIYPSTREESRSSFTKQHPAVSNTPARKQFRNMLSTIRRDKLYKKVPDYVLGISKLPEMLEQFHSLDELQKSIEDVPDYVALKLLDSDFPDEHVRAFAVRALENLSDEQLEDYLLQLVQALKFEANHDSELAQFLLKKALTNKTIGHFFFWYLKSEMHSRVHTARFAVILETYLKGCGESLLTQFTDQVDIQNSLCDMASKLKKECEGGADLEKMQALLPSHLERLDSSRFLFIPVHNPRQVLGKLNPKKCKVMSSKKRPMWLEMYNIHPSALRQSPIRLILKLGDDLRQDMITLRMFSLFEKLWEEQGLDLELIPYGCMATGPQTGFIEVVKNARTIKEVSSVTNSTKLFEWIKSHQTNEFGEIDREMVDGAVKRFTRSCAGYSVATYVLGIGDRHNDNIMVTTSGNLFHIDFGHFLGHIKYFMGFKREWAPFVLTPDFVYVMGGENSEMFETYKNLCCRAFLTLRRNADLIINLFSLMRSTGIPELTCVEDTDYIRNVLEIGVTTSEHVAEMRFRKVIQRCLNLKWTVQIMWRLHIAKNGSE